MVATAAARRNLLLVDGENYPGFLSYNGNDSELDFGGVIYHEGTIEISNVKENPRSVDCREYPTYWCYGKKIELWMADGNNVMKLHPRGRLYIVSSYYDYQSQLLTLKVGCKLTLRKVVTIDDFKTPEELFPDPESPTPTPTPTPTPSPTPTPTPTPAPVGNKWWQQYERVGKEKPASSIVSELVSRAGCGSVTGSVSGNIKLPFSLSGSLISQAGELVFKSSGKYLWNNNNGSSIITDIDFDAAPDLICELGKQEVDFKPIDSGLPAIAELIVSATVKEKDDNGITEETPEGRLTVTTTNEYGPQGVITMDATDTFEVLFATVTQEDLVGRHIKTYTTTRSERACLVIPELESLTARWNFVTGIKTTKTQTYDVIDGKLIREEEIVEEPKAKVFASYISRYANYLNASSGQIGAELATDLDLIISSKKLTLYFYDINKTLKSKTMTIYRPGGSIVGEYFPLIEDTYAIEQETEFWNKSFGKNETYQKIYKKTFWELHQSTITQWEEVNREKLKERGDLDKTSAITTDGRNVSLDSQSLYKKEGDTWNESQEKDKIIPWRLKPGQVLTLITYKEDLESSRTGQASPPATEYLPVENEDPYNEYKDVPIYRVRKWLNSSCSEFKPPREYTQLGEIYNKDIISKLTKIAFRLRQGKTKSYELVLPLTYAGNYWLLDNYKPVQIVKVVWPNGKAAQFLASGVNFSVTQDSNLVLLDLLWLGNYNGNVVDDYISASTEHNLIKAYPLLISDTEAVLTEGGGYVQIGG